MSDNCLHIVPKHSGDYPNAAVKAKEILKWFQDRDIVEIQLSDCILSMEKQGYKFNPNIASIFNDGELWAYSENSIIHGLELVYGERTVFCPAEGMYLIITCPNCEKQIEESTGFNWIANWYQPEETDYPKCTNCGKKRHLTEYKIEPEWGFSNIGISLWNTHWDLKPEFKAAMEKLFGTEILVVEVRI